MWSTMCSKKKKHPHIGRIRLSNMMCDIRDSINEHLRMNVLKSVGLGF